MDNVTEHLTDSSVNLLVDSSSDIIIWVINLLLYALAVVLKLQEVNGTDILAFAGLNIMLTLEFEFIRVLATFCEE